MLDPLAKEFVPNLGAAAAPWNIPAKHTSVPIPIALGKQKSPPPSVACVFEPGLAEPVTSVDNESNGHDLHFDEVFEGAADSRQSSVASEAVGEASATTAEAKNHVHDLSVHPLENGLVEAAQTELDKDGPVQSSCATDSSSTKVGPHDFEILRVVGQGAFGKVFQVRYKRTDEVYAMKVMRKEKILAKEHSEYVKGEREVLTAMFHPYIVALRFSFQTPSKLYLVLDFINGGHLFFNLYRQGVFSEDVARLYTAEIVSALTYLHSRGIVHRDLKPENVLLDSEGHIKLTDFGLAKQQMDSEQARTNSFIGTMEYMAPEIVEGKGHGKEVDWWSTGILLYEMLCGMPPFRAKSRNALQNQILSSKVKYPKFLSSDSQNLLKGLLTRDPTKRLGYGNSGSEMVRRHAFFRGVNWLKLEKREIESKFKPMVKNVLSVENFDKIWTDQPAEDSPCGTPTGSEAFNGFTYVAPSFFTSVMEQNVNTSTPSQTASTPSA